MKKINTECLLQIIILVFINVCLFSALNGDRLQQYIHPRIEKLLWLSVGAILLIALFKLQGLFRLKRKTNWGSNLILIIPLIAAVAIPSASAGYKSSQKIVEGKTDVMTAFELDYLGENDNADNSNKQSTHAVRDVQVIDDNEFLEWYQEVNNNPDAYEGKTVKVKATVFRRDDFEKNEFVAARMAMTCCAADLAPIGFLCKSDKAEQLDNDTWVYVTAVIKVEYQQYMKKSLPVLYATKITLAPKPEEEYIYP